MQAATKETAEKSHSVDKKDIGPCKFLYPYYSYTAFRHAQIEKNGRHYTDVKVKVK